MASSTTGGGLSWSGMLSYWTVMSMAIQSSRFEQGMNVELAQMALVAEQSESLQQASLESQNLAGQLEEVVESEQAEVVELQSEAAVFFDKSNADMALATTTEQEAIDELAAQITTEEEQSTQHAAVAALDEETYEHEFEQATADAAEASRLETLARGDEASIVLCEWVPFLDVVCDWVGGITAVGMESDAASLGVKSSSELLAASAAKLDEQVEVDLATEFQTKSVEGMAALGELQTEQDELIELAEAERTEAEDLELQADELQQDVEAEEEQAAQNEMHAEEEEAEADALGEQAIQHGVKACWNSMLANVLSGVAATFFVLRTSFMFIIPYVAKAYTYLYDGYTYYNTIEPHKSTTSAFPSPLLRDTSYVVQHCVIFLLTLIAWRTTLMGLTQFDDVRVRGGIILVFALTGGIIQTLLLHTIPGSLVAATTTTSTITTHRMICSVATESVQRSFLLPVLFALEILILWVNLGTKGTPDGNSSDIINETTMAFPGALWLNHLLQKQHGCMLGGLLALIVLLHLWFLELPHRRCHWAIHQSGVRSISQGSAALENGVEIGTATAVFCDVESGGEHKPLLVSNVMPDEQLKSRGEPSTLVTMTTATVVDRVVDVADDEQRPNTAPTLEGHGVKAIHCQEQTEMCKTSSQSVESTMGSLYQSIDLGNSSQLMTTASSATATIYGTHVSSARPLNESTVALHPSPHPHPIRDYSFLQELYSLQLPFEILVLSCMVALISHCLPAFHVLWPASKALLWNSRPPWLSVKWACTAGGVALGMIVVLMAYRCKTKFEQNRRR